MKIEKLNEANRIVKDIDKCYTELHRIKTTLSDDVEKRIAYFSCDGLDIGVTVPASLFKTIGNLIAREYTKEINKLENQLDKL